MRRIGSPSGHRQQPTVAVAHLARASLLALLVAGLAVSVLPVAVGASEPTPEEATPEGAEGIRLLTRTIPVPNGAAATNAYRSTAMWPWVRGGRLLHVGGDHLGVAQRSGPEELVALDFETGEELQRVTLERPMHGSLYDATGISRATIDEETGRFFYGYGIEPSLLPKSAVDEWAAWLPKLDLQPWQKWVSPDEPTGIPWTHQTIALLQEWTKSGADPDEFPDRGIASGPPPDAAPGTGTGGPPSPGGLLEAGQCLHVEPCFGGVAVVDGKSLETTQVIPLEALSLEGGSPAAAELRAIRHSPPRFEGDAEKLHLVVEEFVHEPSQHYASATEPAWRVFPRWNGGNIVSVIQLDLESGTQDWAVRVDACRGSREPSTEQRGVFGWRPNAAQVMRTGDPEDAAIWVGCHSGSTQVGTVVRIPLDEHGFPAQLPAEAGDPIDATDAALAGEDPALMTQNPSQEAFPGPDQVVEMLADPPSGRVLMRALDTGSGTSGPEVWWVFDTTRRQYLGTIGIGPSNVWRSMAALEPLSGRLYVLHGSPLPGREGNPGLYVADIRRNPIPQALYVPLPEPLPERFEAQGALVGAVSADGPNYFFWRSPGHVQGPSGETMESPWRVMEDTLPVSTEAEAVEDFAGRTLDLDEMDEVTRAAFDGAARGFGFRAILTGGLEGATRVGPADPLGVGRGALLAPGNWEPENPVGMGSVLGMIDRKSPAPDGCTDADRQIVLGFVGPEGPAVVETSGARGGTQPVLIDGRTGTDMEQPVSRCAPPGYGWGQLWDAGLVANPPAEEPAVPWPFQESRSSCISGQEQPRDSEAWGDPVTGNFSSEVECDAEQAQGWGQARGADLGDVRVTEAISSFRIYRDAERGIVARVESVTRGINIDGLIEIDTVRGVAESWANGRRSNEVDPELERDLGLGEHDHDENSGAASGTAGEQDPEDPKLENPYNCDRTRTAGTCFSRHIFGVRAMNPSGEVVYQCGPCGDEQALITGLDRALGTNGKAHLRDPDPRLARGAANGYIAAIQKADHERFADMILNNDLLQTTLPALEIIRYTSPNRPNKYLGTAPRGRQVYQFAGVEVSSSYGIECLLEYDPESNTCAPPTEAPASLTVELADLDGAPLAGGAFTVHRDNDGDGLLGLIDELLEDGGCVTAADGVGTCRFDSLVPGSYLVSQTAAPKGFAPADGAFGVTLSPGAQQTVTFTNGPSGSRLEITVTDQDGTPLAGVVFAVVDADSGEVVATCMTDSGGVCTISVPPGPYVLRQTGAPDGFSQVEDIPFVFEAAGQVAEVTFTLAMAGDGSPQRVDPAPAAGPAPAVVPVSFAPSLPAAAPSVRGSAPMPPTPVMAPQALGETIIRVIRAPAAMMRLAARSPVEAASFVAVFLLFALSVLAVQRRMRLAGLVAAFAGLPSGSSAPPVPPHAGPSGPSGGPAGPGGGRSPDRPGGTPQVASLSAPSLNDPQSTGMHAVAAVLGRLPVVAGAAPSSTDHDMVKVVIATDFPALAAVVTQKLAASPGCELVAAVDSVDALREVLSSGEVDVLVVDLALPTGGPEDICDLLAELHDPERTVGLIPPNRAAEALVTRGYQARLAGMLVADEDLGNGQLAYAVRAVAADRLCYGPAVQVLLVKRWGDRPPKRRKARGLTRREQQVAELAADGLSRTEIAKRLYLSPGTIKRHLWSIRAKLGVTDPMDRDQLRRRLDDFQDGGDSDT